MIVYTSHPLQNPAFPPSPRLEQTLVDAECRGADTHTKGSAATWISLLVSWMEMP